MQLPACTVQHVPTIRGAPQRRHSTTCRAASAPPTGLPPAPAPYAPNPGNALKHLKCLKEWAVTVEALGDGSQTVLLRKGGIKEPLFRPEASTFVLFPTLFHTKQQLLKPGVAERYAQAMRFDPKAVPSLELPYLAQVTGAWATYEPEVLQATHDLHVWTDAFIETRLKWRKAQPITVLELRVWRLRTPLPLPLKEDYFGCFSWVDVSEALPAEGLAAADATPALADAVFAQRQRQLRAALQSVNVEPLQL